MGCPKCRLFVTLRASTLLANHWIMGCPKCRLFVTLSYSTLLTSEEWTPLYNGHEWQVPTCQLPRGSTVYGCRQSWSHKESNHDPGINYIKASHPTWEYTARSPIKVYTFTIATGIFTLRRRFPLKPFTNYIVIYYVYRASHIAMCIGLAI